MWGAVFVAFVLNGSAQPTAQALTINAPPPLRCAIRVSARGITVDGNRMGRDAAVALCKQRTGAIVGLNDDAPPAEWKQLRAELEAARVPILMRGVEDHRECMNNPLAKGCGRAPSMAQQCMDDPLAKGCL